MDQMEDPLKPGKFYEVEIAGENGGMNCGERNNLSCSIKPQDEYVTYRGDKTFHPKCLHAILMVIAEDRAYGEDFLREEDKKRQKAVTGGEE